MSRPPLPPFNAETAAQKARMAEDGWNSRDPGAGVARLYAAGLPLLAQSCRIHCGAR